ncbi:MAG: tyrosine-type recombinase/integrase, partial [Desulfobacterales bacterium]|nr:tyrosine-type recombinase/integrase [Desulfobacterales bacterium]
MLKAPTKLRDRIILRLLYYCAMRISEAMGLMIEDIDFVDRVIKICHALTRSGKPKEQKERFVPVDAETLRLIVEYAGARTRGRLFDIKIRRGQRLVKRYAKEAGIPNWEEISAHKLRHSFATHYYKETKDLLGLQKLLGHSRPETTQIYAHVDLEDVVLEYKRVMKAISESRVKPVTLQ